MTPLHSQTYLTSAVIKPQPEPTTEAHVAPSGRLLPSLRVASHDTMANADARPKGFVAGGEGGGETLSWTVVPGYESDREEWITDRSNAAQQAR